MAGMKLYHFTFVAHVPAMLGADLIDGPSDGERGIRPGAGDFQTAGRPVVWLSSRDTLKPTAADLQWESKRHSAAEMERYAIAGPIGDRTVRLTVELSNSRRLRHYGTWVREQDDALLAAFSAPSVLADYWIYFGTIQRERIVEIARTDAPFNNDAERMVWQAANLWRAVERSPIISASRSHLSVRAP